MVADETHRAQRVPPRKRAPGACLACRARKVRCDVAQRGAPCTNCSFDKNDCVVKARPSRYRTAQSRTDTPPRVSRPVPTPPVSEETQPEDQLCSIARPERHPTDRGSNTTGNMPDENLRVGQHATSNYEDSSDQSEQNIYRSSPGQSEDPNAAVRLPLEEPFMFDDTATQADSESPASVDTHVIFSFYPFLKLHIQSHMSPQDVNFLEQQTCFRVPTKPALDELVREYFLHVHPSLPIIDEGTFWEMYTYRARNPTEKPGLSLFVFQAMLFASCSFVSLACIRRLGFTSTRAARAAYYRRAKFLFDFNGELDPISTAQGTLLLTYNSSMRNYKQVNTFWLGIAIQCAKDGDAHRYHTKPALTAEQRNVLKRLWWCCILRDRILPLGVRRPLHINETDFDFDVAPLTKEDFESEIGRSKVYSSCTKSSLVELFLALCSLAVSLTEVIMTIYPLNGSFDSRLLDEQNTDQTFDRIRSCQSNLSLWFEKATTEFPTPAGIGDAHESIILYTNLMYMYYHSAMLALYHREILVLAIKPTGSHWNRMCRNKRQVEEAASAMTDHLKELMQLKLAKYLPISVVAYAAFPLVLHVLDVKLSTTESQTSRKQRRLNIYTEAMKVLQSQYDGTDEVADIISTMTNYISLERPIQSSRLNINRDSTEFHQNGSGPRAVSLKTIKNSKAIKDWGDVLLCRTNLYLRLAITIDLSLSKGRFPDDADFPRSLQSPSQIKTRFPLYRITVGDTSESNTGAVDFSSHDPYSRIKTGNGNRLFSSLTSANEGLTGEGEIPPNQEYPDLPIYFGAFDMGMTDNGSLAFDHPAAWADGMFLDGV
ncbi:fungal-specific transcription factor domain-containing protein [Halenospora varia]|nr:fungal-specific transcription factor domain-containing protein [Halenospora varia]